LKIKQTAFEAEEKSVKEQQLSAESEADSHPINKKSPKIIGDFTYQCAGEDLNLHVLRHTHLKRACLPIPAPAHLAKHGVL